MSEEKDPTEDAITDLSEADSGEPEPENTNDEISASGENDNAPRDHAEDSSEDVPGGESDPGFADMEARLAEAQASAQKWSQEYQSLLEEFKLAKKRYSGIEEWQQKYERLLSGVFQCIADLQRGISIAGAQLEKKTGAPETSGSEKLLGNLLAGFAQVRDGLYEMLIAEHEVQTVEPEVGESFNPAFHEAVDAVEDSGMPDNSVLEVVGAGYVCGEKVLQPARVKVARNKVSKEGVMKNGAPEK